MEILGRKWTFEEHVMELRRQATRRLSILNRAANAIWGLESRIFSIATHALIESEIYYGLAVRGTH